MSHLQGKALPQGLNFLFITVTVLYRISEMRVCRTAVRIQMRQGANRRNRFQQFFSGATRLASSDPSCSSVCIPSGYYSKIEALRRNEAQYCILGTGIEHASSRSQKSRSLNEVVTSLASILSNADQSMNDMVIAVGCGQSSV